MTQDDPEHADIQQLIADFARIRACIVTARDAIDKIPPTTACVKHHRAKALSLLDAALEKGGV